MDPQPARMRVADARVIRTVRERMRKSDYRGSLAMDFCDSSGPAIAVICAVVNRDRSRVYSVRLLAQVWRTIRRGPLDARVSTRYATGSGGGRRCDDGNRAAAAGSVRGDPGQAV